jgi:hypothetical protein
MIAELPFKLIVTYFCINDSDFIAFLWHDSFYDNFNIPDNNVWIRNRNSVAKSKKYIHYP